MALLTSCLALVRPVGLSDDNARDWLRVAAMEVAHVPADMLRDACSEARRTCTHHGQIVPAIIKYAGPALEESRKAERRKREWNAEMSNLRRQLPQPDRWRPTDEELEEVKREAARLLRADRPHA